MTRSAMTASPEIIICGKKPMQSAKLKSALCGKDPCQSYLSRRLFNLVSTTTFNHQGKKKNSPSYPGASGMLLLRGACAKRMPNANTRFFTIDDFISSLYQARTACPMDICVNIQLTANSNSAKARAWPGLIIRKSKSRLDARVPSGRVP